ncbi:MAG: acyl-CoA desaturase, partial [Xanthomonadaceae bacterium]|nr:acyl-CoA desaturase [Xanthomonadaceae bacterium]
MTLWFDTAGRQGAPDSPAVGEDKQRIDVSRVIPFIVLHVACLAVIWVGISAVAVAVALASYLLRMFAITAFYHRYFSHRAFRASRTVQFLFAVLGATATQRG